MRKSNSTITKHKSLGLTTHKKKILKSLQGSATTTIDLNKLREKQKYEEN